MKTGFFLILVLLSLANCNTPPFELKVSSGTLQRIEAFPSDIFTPRNIDIWLPPGFNEEEKYAVLYMHDGQMLFDSTFTWNGQEWGVDEVMGKLLAQKRIRQTIVIGIWNDGTTRHADYFPQKPFLQLSKSFRDSLQQEFKRYDQPLFSRDVRSDDYLAFLVKELKPYIDAHFPTYTDPANTFVAGSSMGGLISMYAICEYPEVFGGAACLSTHWPGIFTVENNPVPGQFLSYLQEHLPDPATHKLYFDYGTETLDSLYEPFQLRADTILSAHGFDQNNWITLKCPGESHSERSWHKRLDRPLLFLLGDHEPGDAD